MLPGPVADEDPTCNLPPPPPSSSRQGLGIPPQNYRKLESRTVKIDTGLGEM